MVVTTIITVGHHQMQLNLTVMQTAFGEIVNSKNLDYQVIKSGLDAIQNVVDFLIQASKDKNQKFGYLGQLAHIKNYTKCLQQNISHAIFIQTAGKVDLQAQDIFKPSSNRTLSEAEFILSSSMIGKIILFDLKQYMITPLSETLKEMEKVIEYRLKNAFLLQEGKASLLSIDPSSHPLQFEIRQNEGTDSMSHQAHKGSSQASVKETPLKEIKLEEYQELMNSLKMVNEHQKFLQRIDSAVEKYPHFGFTSIAN